MLHMCSRGFQVPSCIIEISGAFHAVSPGFTGAPVFQRIPESFRGVPAGFRELKESSGVFQWFQMRSREIQGCFKEFHEVPLGPGVSGAFHEVSRTFQSFPGFRVLSRGFGFQFPGEFRKSQGRPNCVPWGLGDVEACYNGFQEV